MQNQALHNYASEFNHVNYLQNKLAAAYKLMKLKE